MKINRPVLSHRETQLKAKAVEKAQAVFTQAEKTAQQRGYIDANKWQHICTELQNKLAEAYQWID